MNRDPVTSSNIASIGYDQESQTLEIEFQNGAVYQYFDVPSSIHEELMKTSSLGSYLNQHIKGAFRYARV